MTEDEPDLFDNAEPNRGSPRLFAPLAGAKRPVLMTMTAVEGIQELDWQGDMGIRPFNLQKITLNYGLACAVTHEVSVERDGKDLVIRLKP